MAVELTRPYWLLTLPLCSLLLWLLARRWPRQSRKAQLSHGLHQVMVLLTVLALAGTSVLSPAQEKAAWLLVDASASMDGQDASQLAREALTALQPGEKAGVIVFGGNAMVETPLGEAPAFSGVGTAVEASGSDLNQALRLAAALLPEEASGGVAVISDGLVDSVDASALQARGIAVNTLKTSADAARDAQITRLQLPATAYQGQGLTMTVTAHSTVEAEAKILLLENGEPFATRDVTLRRGENTFVFQSVAASSGTVTYEAQMLLPGDANPRNDALSACTTVAGVPAILLAEGRTGEGAELCKMLEAAGMKVETMLAASLPEQGADYMTWQAIALVNADADTLTDTQMTALSTAARELGRGVAVFGGDSSYALGGYRGSLLEEMLPITIDVKNKLDLPSTALLLVIDKSGSMTSGQYGVTRLEVAKEAACRALEVLSSQDMAGVITFDDQGKWVLPLSRVENIAAMQETIGTIRPGGGTAFYTPLAMALNALEQAEAQHKHVIFLTDGEAGDRGYERLVEQMAEKDISLTAVAIGQGADRDTMLRLAEMGNGRAYAAGEFDNVPKIFTKETMLAAGTYVQNRTFTPIVTDDSMTDFPGFPQLTGYLAGTEKPLATVSMISDREDPILCWWQYGAGRVACWTSDVQGGWSGAFLQWEDAAAFFGGILALVLPVWEQSGEMQRGEDTLTFTPAMPMENASLTAHVLTPEGERLTLPMEQVSATGYAVPWTYSKPGAYAVQITAEGQEGSTTLLEGGTVVPYAKEYDLRTRDSGILEELSATTGGQAVATAADLLTFPQSNARTRTSLTQVLMSLALLLLLADIAQRRLNWEKALPAETPAKPKAKKPNHPPKAPKATTAPSGQTTQALWESRQNRKRL